MPTALRVEAAVAGRRRAGTAQHRIDIGLDQGPTPLRELVDAVVRAEIVAFHQRAEEQTFVRVLTEKSLGHGLAAGTVRSGGREVPTEVDPDAAVRTALLAQQDGLYQVFVDDEPIDDLDATVTLGPDTRLMFLRLVPLAGG